MREILFRAKRIDNGAWVYGDLIRMGDRAFIANGWIIEGTTEDFTAFDCDKLYEVDPNTIGQYTGLNDANEKQIFEGDFVRLKSVTNGKKKTLLKGVVKYENGAFCVHISMHKHQTKGLLSGFTDSFHADGEGMFCEIIGNTHDNPEFLKQKE